MLQIIKKYGTKEEFNEEKIFSAIKKSADRVGVTLSEHDNDIVYKNVMQQITTGIIEGTMSENIPVLLMHSLVEVALEKVNPIVAKSYKDYRNYKTNFVAVLDDVYRKSQTIRYLGDKENANTDGTIVSTKRSLIYNEFNKELYNMFFLTDEEKQACIDGYIYIHDKSARLDTMNCCLFDAATVMKGGFEMSNLWYNEPKSIDVACDVLSDIILMAASQQYGGFSVPEVDKILAPYVEKTYEKYKSELLLFATKLGKVNMELVEAEALKRTKKDLEQGIQGLEMKLNTVSSSRGDFAFVTFSFGEDVTNKYSLMVSSALMNERKKGQGKKGKEKCVLFPKLVFLYHKDLHGEGAEYEWLFDEAIDCCSKAMYPDILAIYGDNSVGQMYDRYKKVITPMGCRAFLSPYYGKGGFYPADENDEPVFVGRFNVGAISLHLPMIYMKAKTEDKDFYEVLDYYLEMIRNLHLRTYEYLGNLRASCNPLAYCEGGFYGGHLKPEDKIAPVLKSATASFGITALNELQQLHSGKSLYEDNEFALEVMNHINNKTEEFKKIDGRMYAIYGTPGESLCGTQVKQFRKKYGIIPNVSDREFLSNSFHCHVSENINGAEKQDSEKEFWNLFNGGKIQYVKYSLGYNKEAIKTLVRRAMDLGFYEGVNLDLNFCENCGHKANNIKDVCPVCGSDNIVTINRVNGYLGYSRVKGETRFNESKQAEVEARISM